VSVFSWTLIAKRGFYWERFLEPVGQVPFFLLDEFLVKIVL